jgi:hypothetical protein
VIDIRPAKHKKGIDVPVASQSGTFLVDYTYEPANESVCAMRLQRGPSFSQYPPPAWRT